MSQFCTITWQLNTRQGWITSAYARARYSQIRKIGPPRAPFMQPGSFWAGAVYFFGNFTKIEVISASEKNCIVFSQRNTSVLPLPLENKSSHWIVLWWYQTCRKVLRLVYSFNTAGSSRPCNQKQPRELFCLRSLRAWAQQRSKNNLMIYLS